jgi:hypothetical protein
MTYSHTSCPSPRTDYADAVAENLRLARLLATTQPDDWETVKHLIDKQRQAQQTAICCADPAVLARADTERPGPLEAPRAERDAREDSCR